MEKDSLQIYTARITQANRSELVVIVYEITLDALEEAKRCCELGEMDLFTANLQKAIKLVNELMCTLDFQYILSLDLMQLYLYVNKTIINAKIKKNPEILDSAIEVLNRLLVGFEGVAKSDDSAPVMRNTQQLYAGLTYGKGTLNETSIDPGGQNRGFRA